jgi:ribosomal protein L11 methyltransferase
MRHRHLWRISVRVAAEAEEAVAELLGNVFGQPACICTDAVDQTTHAIVYLERKSEWTDRKRARLIAALRQMRSSGLEVGHGRISVARIRREDWAESWKRHFQPVEIGPELLVEPSWSRRQARPGQAVVVLDPGLSFGTGQHPTTQFCLKQLVAFRCPGKAQSFLDIGTGSGVLAVAAAKLGYGPVDGFDVDPEAIRIAKSNARVNNVSAQLRLRHADLVRLSKVDFGRYDLICANLTGDLLLTHKNRISSHLRPDGWLVLAGILTPQFSAIRKAYEDKGLKLVASQVRHEWRSGVFSFCGSGIGFSPCPPCMAQPSQKSRKSFEHFGEMGYLRDNEL